MFVYCFSDQYSTINDFISIYHLYYDVFRPVIAAIFGQGYSNIKGKNSGGGFCFTIKMQPYNLVIVSNNWVIKCM